MDKRRAKELLGLYRPGTQDALDPQVAEALQEAQRDPELTEWFNEQCGVCIALRSKLKQIEVPPDLKRKILLGSIGRRRALVLPRPGPLLACAGGECPGWRAVLGRVFTLEGVHSVSPHIWSAPPEKPCAVTK